MVTPERVAALNSQLQRYKQLLEEIQQTQKEEGLGVKKAGLEDLKQAGDLTRPVVDKLKALHAELGIAQAQLAAVGNAAMGPFAEGMAKAAKDIEELSSQLAKKGPADQISALDALDIKLTEIETAATEAETAWQKKYQEGTAQVTDRIFALQQEAKAIGGTYEQQRAAFVAQQLRGKEGIGPENYAAYLAGTDSVGHRQDVEQLSGKLGAQFDQEHANQQANALVLLQKKIDLTNAAAAAEKYGAAAVKAAELEIEIAYARRNHMSEEYIAHLRAEAAAVTSDAAQKELDTLKEQATAMERLAAAYGAKARLQAEAQNAYDASLRKNSDPTLAEAARAEVYQKNQSGITTEAKSQATATSDQIQYLQQKDAVLAGITKTDANALEVEIARAEIAKQILELEGRLFEKADSVLDGLKGGLDRLATSAEHVGQIIADAMQKLEDQTANILADMLTGQKPKHSTWGQQFGKMFQQEGHQLVQASIKNGMAQLAKVLIPKKPHLPDPIGRSAAQPWYVTLVGGAAPGNAVPNPVGNIMKQSGAVFGAGAIGGGIFSMLGGLLGSGGGSGLTPSVTSAISFPAMAEGGAVYAGSPVWVGDGGEPELFTPHSDGTVTPASKLGGETHYHTHNYSIDARGADIGVESRVAQAIEEAHNSAIQTSLRAENERHKRTPTRSGH
jgi:hypothetical protein